MLYFIIWKHKQIIIIPVVCHIEWSIICTDFYTFWARFNFGHFSVWVGFVSCLLTLSMNKIQRYLTERNLSQMPRFSYWDVESWSSPKRWAHFDMHQDTIGSLRRRFQLSVTLGRSRVTSRSISHITPSNCKLYCRSIPELRRNSSWKSAAWTWHSTRTTWNTSIIIVTPP